MYVSVILVVLSVVVNGEVEDYLIHLLLNGNRNSLLFAVATAALSALSLH